MRMHLIAAVAVICLAMPVSAGELDREFKGADVKALTTTAGSKDKSVASTELDKESPVQAWRRGGWGGFHGGWGWGGGYRGWGGYHGGWGWGVGYRGWGGYGYGWGGYRGWGLSAAYYWPSYSYFPSYYYPAVSYSYYPAWGYVNYGYPSYYCCW
ncbi:MAG TPA: hypothetical protein VHR66_18165 [Gemmataceae bacterium]|nr:hypothetical protein [Gemmataceae bacterium]